MVVSGLLKNVFVRIRGVPVVQWRRAALLVALSVAAAAASGCASFKITPLDELGFQQRLESEADEDVRVTVGVLSADESKAAFGVPLASKGIQPVWVEVENRSDAPYWLWMVATDPEYYSPIESAYYFKGKFSSGDRRRLYAHFDRSRFDNPIQPGSTESGFIFTNLDKGVKNVNVDLLTFGEKKQFSFIVDVPGLDAAHNLEMLTNLYGPEEFTDCPDLESLRAALEQLPPCTTNKSGKREGDPITFFLVGSRLEIFPPFVRRNWHQTEAITAESVLKTVGSSLFGTQYRYSPISALYYFGRPQDIGGQKARGTVNRRNHVRLWLTPVRYRGMSVWAGAVSRDIGVKLTTKSSTLTTHVIDPDLDEARDYLVQDLLYSNALYQLGYVRGGYVSTVGDPRQNLGGDPYFTDGLRAVLFFTEEPVAPWDMKLLDWELPRRAPDPLKN